MSVPAGLLIMLQSAGVPSVPQLPAVVLTRLPTGGSQYMMLSLQGIRAVKAADAVS